MFPPKGLIGHDQDFLMPTYEDSCPALRQRLKYRNQKGELKKETLYSQAWVETDAAAASLTSLLSGKWNSNVSNLSVSQIVVNRKRTVGYERKGGVLRQGRNAAG